MVKLVDRDAKRQEILDGFLRYVAEDGLPAATSRGLAQRLNQAVGTLWRYFDSFEEVVVEAYRYSFSALTQRLATRAELPGLDGLRAVLGDLLPFSSETEYEGQVALGYVGFKGKHAELALIEGEMERTWAAHLHDRLWSARNLGELRSDADLERLTEVLLVTVLGLQMQWAVPNSANRTLQRQQMVLNDAVRPWLQDRADLFIEEQLSPQVDAIHHLVGTPS